MNSLLNNNENSQFIFTREYYEPEKVVIWVDPLAISGEILDRIKHSRIEGDPVQIHKLEFPLSMRDNRRRPAHNSFVFFSVASPDFEQPGRPGVGEGAGFARQV